MVSGRKGELGISAISSSSQALLQDTGYSGMVTSALNDVAGRPHRELGGCDKTERNGLFGRLRKLYICMASC